MKGITKKEYKVLLGRNRVSRLNGTRRKYPKGTVSKIWVVVVPPPSPRPEV